ncbi:MAG: transposase [Candidatus Paceibacterota bacterium]|jgi:putative transposase
MFRDLSFAPGEFYHLYNRGADKREIFLEPYDYARFTKFLYLANSVSPVNLRETPSNAFSFVKNDTLVDIGAYCLMPNHFHLLVREKSDGNITKFMRKLLTSHSKYFNKKHKRSGTLFEGRFKAKHVNGDDYLKYLLAYIHLNPVKLIDSKWKEDGIKDIEKAKKHLTNYKHSSYLDYLNSNREEEKILNKNGFPEYFETAKGFQSMINNWLDYKNLDF